MTCPFCGRNISDDSIFCSKCGKKIECPSCHSAIQPYDNFCKKCGFKFLTPAAGAGAKLPFIDGNKNVTVADTIGMKLTAEKGSTVNYHSDETKILVQCHICGRKIAISESIVCHRCRETVCEDCFNREVNFCKTCGEDEYRNAFLNARKDRINGWMFLSSDKVRNLEELRERYQIAPYKAEDIQKKVISNEDDYSQAENEYENTNSEIFENGMMEEAYSSLSNLKNRNPFNIAILSKLLYVSLNLASADPGNTSAVWTSEDIINTAFEKGNDSLGIYLVLIDQILDGKPFPASIRRKLKSHFRWEKNTGDLAFAEHLLNKAEEFWAENDHLKFRRLLCLKMLYDTYENQKDLERARKELSLLKKHPEEMTKAEYSWFVKVRIALGEAIDPTPEYCDVNGLYYFILNPWSFEAYYKMAKSIDTSTAPRRKEYFKLLTIAATRFPNPSHEVLTELADCYANGIGTDKNVQAGLEYYKKAAATLGIQIKFCGTVFTSYQDNGTHKEYIVPPGITEIASGAFANAAGLNERLHDLRTRLVRDLAHVVNPSFSILRTPLSPEAGSDRCALETVILPGGLKTIRKDAFMGCDKLRMITIPKNITRLEADFPPDCAVLFAGDTPVKASSFEFDDVFFSVPETVGIKAVAYRFRSIIRSTMFTASWCHEAITGHCKRDCKSCLFCSDHGIAEQKILAFLEFCREKGVSLPVGPSMLNKTDFMIVLAEKYRAGRNGLSRNDAKAAKWWHGAAERGNTGAQIELGKCYETGSGIGKNMAEAARWYRKAAEQGNAEAQFRFAGCCFNGIGLKENKADAIKWYRAAAEQGNAEAQFSLAEFYLSGIGTNKDETEAAKWYRKAAEQGNAEAQFKLGGCCFNGIGTKEDKAEAARWYRKAADQGIMDTWSLYFLGESCFYGWEKKKDYAEAVKWYGKAVEERHGDAGVDSPPFSTDELISRLLAIISDESWPKATADAALAVLVKLSCWDRLSSSEWTDLLLLRPDCAKYCGLTADSPATYWHNLSPKQWKSLAEHYPEFQVFRDLVAGINVVRHLKTRLDAGTFCNWGQVSGTEWVKLLKEKDLIDSLRKQGYDLLQLCLWDDLTEKNWVHLLSSKPEFAPRCSKWERLKDEDYKDLKSVSSQLWASFDKNSPPPLIVIEKMNWGKYMDWRGTTPEQWRDYLIKYPGLADCCDCWNDFSPDDWSKLLFKQPQFAPKCSRWDKFKAKHWNKLIQEHPELEKYFSYDLRNCSMWEQIWNYPDYKGKIGKQLSKCFAFLAPSLFLFVFTIVSLFGKTGWFSLFAEADLHALRAGVIWIVLCALYVTGYASIWGPFIRNRWLNLIYAGLASFSLFTFYHWSFFFSRWSFGLVGCPIFSLLLFFCPIVEDDTGDQIHTFCALVFPYFTVFCWFVLSPVECPRWLIAAIVLLFIISFGLAFTCLDEDDLFKGFILSCIPPLIIGICFLLRPVSPRACYEMADSLRSSFKHASQALYQKGVSSDPDYNLLMKRIDTSYHKE